MRFVPAATLLACFLTLLACFAGCVSHPALTDMTSCVPAGTLLLAGVDLDSLRAAPLFHKLPPAALTLAESYRTAQRLLVAWNGADVLIVIRGSAPGSTPVARNLALMGSPESLQGAVTQCRSGETGSPGLVDYAAKTAGPSPVWIAAKGGVTLPLTGNARNLNRLFRKLEYMTLTVDLTTILDVRIAVLGQSEQAARDFEENLRGFLSLASAAENRRPDITRLLDSVQIRRSGVTASASLRIPADAIDALIAPFAR